MALLLAACATSAPRALVPVGLLDAGREVQPQWVREGDAQEGERFAELDGYRVRWEQESEGSGLELAPFGPEGHRTLVLRLWPRDVVTFRRDAVQGHCRETSRPRTASWKGLQWAVEDASLQCTFTSPSEGVLGTLERRLLEDGREVGQLLWRGLPLTFSSLHVEVQGRRPWRRPGDSRCTGYALQREDVVIAAFECVGPRAVWLAPVEEPLLAEARVAAWSVLGLCR